MHGSRRLRILNHQLVIPDFHGFTNDLTALYHLVEGDTTGANADYIPILRCASCQTVFWSVKDPSGQGISILVPSQLACASRMLRVEVVTRCLTNHSGITAIHPQRAHDCLYLPRNVHPVGPALAGTPTRTAGA